MAQSPDKRLRVWTCAECSHTVRVNQVTTKYGKHEARNYLPKFCPSCNSFHPWYLKRHIDHARTFEKTRQIDKPLSHYRSRSIRPKVPQR